MRFTDTEADRLLKDALRMVRVDSYRLATIVRAYRLCTEALAIWAKRRGDEFLPLRRRRMHTALEDALTRLHATHAVRSRPTDNRKALDATVDRYVLAVEKETREYLAKTHSLRPEDV
jgi:hypothetical protein